MGAQCILMGAMFDKTMPNAKWVGLMEEVLPMTDILPVRHTHVAARQPGLLRPLRRQGQA